MSGVIGIFLKKIPFDHLQIPSKFHNLRHYEFLFYGAPKPKLRERDNISTLHKCFVSLLRILLSMCIDGSHPLPSKSRLIHLFTVSNPLFSFHKQK